MSGSPLEPLSQFTPTVVGGEARWLSALRCATDHCVGSPRTAKREADWSGQAGVRLEVPLRRLLIDTVRSQLRLGIAETLCARGAVALGSCSHWCECQKHPPVTRMP